MAELAQLDFLNFFEDLAFSQSAGDWLSLGINLIVSTIIGGIILVIILGILGKSWGESVHIANSFLVVLIINIINIIGIAGFLSGYPFAFIIPAFIWIILVKLFFHEMRLWHAVVVGVIGYIISIFIVPMLVGMVVVFIPTAII